MAKSPMQAISLRGYNLFRRICNPWPASRNQTALQKLNHTQLPVPITCNPLTSTVPFRQARQHSKDTSIWTDGKSLPHNIALSQQGTARSTGKRCNQFQGVANMHPLTTATDPAATHNKTGHTPHTKAQGDVSQETQCRPRAILS